MKTNFCHNVFTHFFFRISVDSLQMKSNLYTISRLGSFNRHYDFYFKITIEKFLTMHDRY